MLRKSIYENMLKHMRTSFEIPESLFKRAKNAARRRGITMRELVIDGLQRALDSERARAERYRLKDCSAGEGGLIEGLSETDREEIRRRSYEGRGG